MLKSDLFDSFDFKSNLILDQISKQNLDLIASKFETISFNKGDKIFYEDGIPTGMFQIVSGRVKKYKTVIDSHQQIFYVYIENDFFGYHALLCSERYHDTCEAIEPTVINFLSKENFNILLKEIPGLKEGFLKNIAHEFGVLGNIIGVLTQKSLTARLALNIIVLNYRFNKKSENFEGFELSREDLANIIGTSRESLSRSLNELKSKGFIRTEKRKIIILNEKSMLDYCMN
jgi:CRP-like cAMP-binding protein